ASAPAASMTALNRAPADAGTTSMPVGAPASALAASVGTTAATTAATGAEALKVGFVYAGVVGEAGRAFAHDHGRREMEAALGGKVKTTYVERVPEGGDAEPLLRNLVAQGNKLIFGTSPGHRDAMVGLAEE